MELIETLEFVRDKKPEPIIYFVSAYDKQKLDEFYKLHPELDKPKYYEFAKVR
jgi:hypothetical protein